MSEQFIPQAALFDSWKLCTLHRLIINDDYHWVPCSTTF